MLVAAAARELDAVDSRMLRAREPVEAEEARQPDMRLAVDRAGERVHAPQRVVHRQVIPPTPDG